MGAGDGNNFIKNLEKLRMTNNSKLPPCYVYSSQTEAHNAEIASALKNVIFYIQCKKIQSLSIPTSTNIMQRVIISFHFPNNS